MAFNQISQVVEFLANVVTVFGFLVGLSFGYKIYNRIEISFQERYTTNIGKIEVGISREDFSKIAYDVEKLREEIYQIKGRL